MAQWLMGFPDGGSLAFDFEKIEAFTSKHMVFCVSKQ
jgi:hypothetical protein